MSERGDVVDRANDLAAAQEQASEAEIRYRAVHMPAGEPGECALCGEQSARLVGGACARCRDRYRLP